MSETPKLNKISRLNVTLSVLGYQVSVEGDQVHLFNPMKKYAGSLTHEDFQIWAIELTAERAITEYIMDQSRLARLDAGISKVVQSDSDLKSVMIANQKIEAKKASPKKPAAKKASPKKPAAKKASPKKPAAKKSLPKKTSTKKAPRLKMPPIKKVSHRSQG